MPLRSARERAIQTLCFEFGGMALAAPLYALLLVAGAAIGKELWDRRTHPADWLDAAATIAGGLVAAAWNYGVQLV